MSLYKEALQQGGGGKYKSRRTRNRSRWRAWAKNQFSRLMRRKAGIDPENAPTKLPKQGYE